MFRNHFVFLKSLNGSNSKSGSLRMINLMMPTTAILLKKTSYLRQDRFVFTYEYGWSESTEAGNSKKHKSPQVIGPGLCISFRRPWSDITISFLLMGNLE